MIPKFRAWLKKKLCDVSILDMANQMVWVLLPKKDFFTTAKKKIDDVVIMQSTGIFDKDAKEIYEGDVIGEGPLASVVKYYTPCGVWVAELIKYNNYRKLGNVAKEHKIIGNIYENPEMLEV